MCLFPKKIVTPFTRISKKGGQPLFIEVPCNNCAECKQQMRLQWHFRTFYECNECVANGGFIYYDTLTYSDEYLPKLSHFYDISNKPIQDFSCFNHEHFKLFLKRLRRQLAYKHKGVKLKYFLTSEYGTDERFTHRPHYHILFFVYPPYKRKNIHPYRFSRFVSNCWQYGRTDGLPYKSTSYVSRNTFGSAYVHTYNRNYLKVCSYVSKYITKDSEFQSTIDKRIEQLKCYLNDDEIKPLLRSINMFHRQSQGFGISYIQNLNYDEYRNIFNTGSCRIFDNKKVVLTISIPTYFKRKLFYKLHKQLHNESDKITYQWIPTPEGEKYIRNRYFNNIQKSTDKLKETISNLSDYDRDSIYKLLAERDLQDLAIYNLFYRGFSRELTFLSYYINSLSLPHELTDTEYNLNNWIDTIISSKYVSYFDKEDYFERDNATNKLSIPEYYDMYSENTYNYHKHVKKLSYDENSCFAFRDFDKINCILRSYTEKQSIKKQTFDNYQENYKKRFKYLLNYG